jgi:hypothetical protein
MTGLRVSVVYLEIQAPQTIRTGRGRPKTIPPHAVTMEIADDSIQIWDSDCQYQVERYVFGSHSLSSYDRPVGDLPHLDESLKVVAAEYATNRLNPIGALLGPAVRAMEDAIAQRDGSSVYFAAAGDRIKIGWSRKVGSRIAQLQTGNPESVVLLATMPGGRSLERTLHQRFAGARLAGEWFARTPELTALINDLTSNVIPFPDRRAS